jgi:hypothetical protein
MGVVWIRSSSHTNFVFHILQITGLMQDKHVYAYKSCKLNYALLDYYVHEKYYFVVIHALKVWRHYFLGTKFKFDTDHQSLRYLSTHPNLISTNVY